jgi:hypothetical protein
MLVLDFLMFLKLIILFFIEFERGRINNSFYNFGFFILILYIRFRFVFSFFRYRYIGAFVDFYEVDDGAWVEVVTGNYWEEYSLYSGGICTYLGELLTVLTITFTFKCFTIIANYRIISVSSEIFKNRIKNVRVYYYKESDES